MDSPPAAQQAQASSAVPPGWRLVHAFDFEERELGNVDTMPMYWYAIGQEADTTNPNFNRQPLHRELTSVSGYPRYSELGFDHRVATSGQTSFRLGVRGGSAGAFLEVGAVPAVPLSDYHITANVLISQLQHARVRLSAYLVDDQGRRLDDSVVTVRATAMHDRWQRLELRVLGDAPTAAWIGLEAAVEQPRRPTGPAGDLAIVYRDVEGGAWFDDVTIWQVPRVVVGTQSPVNVIRGPQAPKVWAQVRDTSGKALSARLRLIDHRGREVAQTMRDLGDGQGGRWEWEPRVERFGWYKVILGLEDAGAPGVAGRASTLEEVYAAFLYLPHQAPAPASGTPRLGVEATGRDFRELALLPDFMASLGLGEAVLSCWQPDASPDELEGQLARLGGIIAQLGQAGVRTCLNLAPVPRPLATALDIDAADPLFLFGREHPLVDQYLRPVLIREGQRVRGWHIGAGRDTESFYLPNLAQRLDVVRTRLRSAAPEPTIVLPWDVSQGRPAAMDPDVGFVLNIPVAVQPRFLAAAVASWEGGRGTGPGTALESLRLQTPAADQLDQSRRVTDLALRLIEAWRTQPASLLLDSPWTVTADRQTQLLPDPLAGVFACVGRHLLGRRYVDELPVGPGLRALIFHGPPGGLLVVWNESAPRRQATLRMYLGRAPEALDVWGNRVRMPLVDGRHELKVTHSPVLIEGIDTPLAVFRAAFKLLPPAIESTQVRHERALQIHNPWPRTLSGSLRIVDPQDWRIEPRYVRLSIPAGQSMSLPVALAFPVSELGGQRELTAELEFTTDQAYVVRATAPMEIALPDIEWDAQLTLDRRANGGVDALVTQVLQNRGKEPISMYAFASVPDAPRQEQLLAQVMPGQSIMRQFRFVDIGELLGKRQIRVGIREVGGPAGLNKILDLR